MTELLESQRVSTLRNDLDRTVVRYRPNRLQKYDLSHQGLLEKIWVFV